MKPEHLTVTIAGKKHHLDIATAFSLAHGLVIQGHLESAEAVLSWVDRKLPLDQRVKVLQARCAARRGNYDEGSKILCQAFREFDLRIAVSGPLHAIIVYWATGLLADARNDLKELCLNYPELPSLWLFAGDLWLAIGRSDKAEEAWRKAVKCDQQPPRIIATAAKHRIAEVQIKHRSTSTQNGRQTKH